MALEPDRWDVFCKVVDNFGDAGVAWRLARALATEQGKRVRLYIADVAVLARLRPELDPKKELQVLEGVEVARWREEFTPHEIADVVVETFGCDPPVAYVAAMARRQPPPRWVNLEYLSAEDWVEGSHARPSPHPRLPLVKHYYFPGFTARTGGLLREAGLLERRERFQSSTAAQSTFWRALCGRDPPDDALRVSLFSYAGAPVDSLLRSLARGSQPAWCVIPEGPAHDAIRGHELARGALTAIPVPFLAQDRYDQLLWACDVNIVRGEDSFVRAQWAARPFVWHIYPQEQGTHWVKLQAFLGRYGAGLGREHFASLAGLWDAWNRGEALDDAWPAFALRRAVLTEHATGWTRALATRRDLAAELADFVDNVLK